MKRILEVTEEVDFYFLPTEEEVEQERIEEENRRKESKNKINTIGIDSSKNNKVLFLYDGGVFYNAIYSQMIKLIDYQLIKTIDDQESFIEGLKGIVGTEFEPDIVLINVPWHEDRSEYISQLRTLTNAKIVLLGSLFEKEVFVNMLKAGANHALSTPTNNTAMKELFDKVLGMTENKE